jgi:hypothetical protein
MLQRGIDRRTFDRPHRIGVGSMGEYQSLHALAKGFGEESAESLGDHAANALS